MEKIPIQFDYKGKHYKGYFSEVSGGGGNTWHLTIDNYYKDQLIFSKQYGWAFYNNKDEMKVEKKSHITFALKPINENGVQKEQK